MAKQQNWLKLSLQALEGLGESQEVKSQEINLSRPDLDAADATQFNDEGREDLSRSDSGSIEDDFLSNTQLSLQDKGWISPPDSIYSSSSESVLTSGEASIPDIFNNLAEGAEQHSHGSNMREDNEQLNSVPTSQTDFQEISDSGPSVFKHMEVNNGDTSSVKSIIDESDNILQAEESPSDEAETVPVGSSQTLDKESEVKLAVKAEVSSLNKVKSEEDNHEDHIPNAISVNRVARGKYTMYFIWIIN